MNIPKEWWKDFFSGAALDLWRAATSEEQTRAEADFIQKHLQVSPPARLLDVPCGNGRLSVELASRGYQLTGVDLAADFLEEARSNAAARRLTIGWEHRDMRDLPWRGAYDGAFCFGNSFGYFEDSGNEDYLKAVSRTLKPGACFVMDTSATETILPTFQERRWYEFGRIIFLVHNHYDHDEGRLDTEYIFVTDGVEKKFGSQRIYTYSELCRLLGESGFASSQGYSSIAQEAFKLGSQRLLLVTTKT